MFLTQSQEEKSRKRNLALFRVVIRVRIPVCLRGDIPIVKISELSLFQVQIPKMKLPAQIANAVVCPTEDPLVTPLELSETHLLPRTQLSFTFYPECEVDRTTHLRYFSLSPASSSRCSARALGLSKSSAAMNEVGGARDSYVFRRKTTGMMPSLKFYAVHTLARIRNCMDGLPSTHTLSCLVHRRV